MDNFYTIHLAEVKESQLGDSGRNIKVISALDNFNDELKPAFDGAIKLPAPLVGQKVIVLTPDITNINRLYIPVEYSLGGLSNDKDKLQIENTGGDTEVEGSTILLGKNAIDFVALASKVLTEIGNVNTSLAALATSVMAHAHSAPNIIPDNPPVVFVPVVPISVAASKVKAE